ncbi:hypothetical protein FGIG_07956 [Fasciola gigantica]|uniref:Retropepsins domain-containing protein n=1 Tax=Fasciola gigantica TaxID=46835 RepID=A0A504YW97_FASGI|nr:hypothetical protein FGIG_07956 [Fasciola gigantica]
MHVKPPLVKVVIRGHTYWALVDMGATFSLIHPRICGQGKDRAATTRVSAVNGVPVKTCGSCQITLQMEGKTVAHPVVVSPDIPWDLILGHNFLHTNKCCLDLGLGMLIFGDQNIRFGNVEEDDHTINPKSHQATHQARQEQSLLQAGLAGPHGKSLMTDTQKGRDRIQEIQPVDLS